jgi:hypothetical protein
MRLVVREARVLVLSAGGSLLVNARRPSMISARSRPSASWAACSRYVTLRAVQNIVTPDATTICAVRSADEADRSLAQPRGRLPGCVRCSSTCPPRWPLMAFRFASGALDVAAADKDHASSNFSFHLSTNVQLTEKFKYVIRLSPAVVIDSHLSLGSTLIWVTPRRQSTPAHTNLRNSRYGTWKPASAASARKTCKLMAGRRTPRTRPGPSPSTCQEPCCTNSSGSSPLGNDAAHFNFGDGGPGPLPISLTPSSLDVRAVRLSARV